MDFSMTTLAICWLAALSGFVSAMAQDIMKNKKI